MGWEAVVVVVGVPEGRARLTGRGRSAERRS